MGHRRAEGKRNKQKSCATELNMKDVKQNLFSTTSSARGEKRDGQTKTMLCVCTNLTGVQLWENLSTAQTIINSYISENSFLPTWPAPFYAELTLLPQFCPALADSDPSP